MFRVTDAQTLSSWGDETPYLTAHQSSEFWAQQRQLTAAAIGTAALFMATAYAMVTIWYWADNSIDTRTADWLIPLRLAFIAGTTFAAFSLLKKSTAALLQWSLIYVVFALFTLMPAIQAPLRMPALNVYQGSTALVGTIMLSAVLVRIQWQHFAAITLAASLAYVVMLTHWSGAALQLTEFDQIGSAPSLLMYLQLSIILMISLAVHRLVEWRERRLFVRSLQVEALSRQRLQLMKALGHDLQQPLSAINLQAASALIAMRQGKASEAEKSLHEAEQSLQWAQDELEQLTEVAALDDADFQPPLNRLSPVDVITPVTEALSLVAARNKLTLQFCYKDLAGFQMVSNTAVLQRVLSNLICNAIHYGVPEHGSKKDRYVIRVKARVNTAQTKIKITVTDHGQGISAQEQAKIWQPLYRGTNVNRRQQPGSGLGLWLVHCAIEKLPGHSVKLRSELKKGTTFELSVPISQIDRSISTPSVL